jgi:LysR family nitrogen assimilation transcriptional regulator
MDIRQLRYFVKIVELGSMTAASQALHIAQPSLSKHVSNLEEELGIQLLQRSPNGVQATEAGNFLCSQSRALIRQLEETRQSIKARIDNPSGQVSLGLPTSTSHLLAVPLLERVRAQFPNITLCFTEGSTASLAEAVARQESDMALGVNIHNHHGMHVTHVLDEEIVVFAHASYADHGPISLQDLSGRPLILPSFPNSIRVLYEQALATTGLPLNLLAETSVSSIAMAAVANGLALALQPCSAQSARELQYDVVALRIADLRLSRRMSLCMSQAAQRSRACNAVSSILLELMHEMVITKKWPGSRLIRPSSDNQFNKNI